MDDPAPVISELEEKNALALAIVPVSGIQFIYMAFLIYHSDPIFLVNM